jgi:undecaprenyl-diphosphatase
VTGVDHTVFRWFVDSRTPFLTHVARVVMDVGNSNRVLALAGLLLVAVLLVVRQWVAALAVAAAPVGALAVTLVVKHAVGRARPPARLALVAAGGYSMPSAVGAITMAVALAMVLGVDWGSDRRRLLGGVVLGVAVLVAGWAVVYLGAHWPTDVLVGWVVGAASAVVAARLARELLARAPEPFRVVPPTPGGG